MKTTTSFYPIYSFVTVSASPIRKMAAMHEGQSSFILGLGEEEAQIVQNFKIKLKTTNGLLQLLV
jgi:hypothetical protein